MLTIHEIGEFHWYSFFYLLSSILSFVLLVFLGWKKGYPLLSWLLILVTGALFFIIGTKLFTFKSGEWSLLLREGIFPKTDGRSAIGGLIFAILGVQMSRSWLKVKAFVLDTYVLIVPIALALQKPGCIMAGCCFGTPTSLPWGIRYAIGTPAHYHQWLSHAIPIDQPLSLPVHPVPLYEGLSYLLILGVLFLLAPRLNKRGSRFLIALALLALSRFIIEFFRAPEATYTLGTTFGGLKAIQWVLLFMTLVTGILFVHSLRRPVFPQDNEWGSEKLSGRRGTLILSLSILIWFVHTGFSFTEMLVMNLKFLPALVLFGFHYWVQYAVPRFRVTGIVLMILPLLFMGQSIPMNGDGYQRFHSFGMGTSFGSLDQVVRYNEHEGSCGPAYSRKYFNQKYGTVTLNYNYTRLKGKERISYGASLFSGVTKETEDGTSVGVNHYLVGVHPYLNYDTRWIGLGFGASMGLLNYFPTTPFNERSINSGVKTFPLLPSGFIRVGPYDIVNLEYRFQDEFPAQLPMLTHQFSIGSGFGRMYGSTVRLGLAGPEMNYFLTASAGINDQWQIHGMYMYTTIDYPEKRYGNFFSLGLTYKLPALQRPAKSATKD